MLFDNYEFIFLPPTWFIYFYLNSKRFTELSKSFLIFSLLFFFSWWDITYLPLILISFFVNYMTNTSLDKSSKGQDKIVGENS